MSLVIMCSHWIPSAAKACTARALLAALCLASALLQPVAAVATYSDEQIRATESDQERELNDIRDQEINQLKIVLGRRMAANRRPDLLLRLGELYLEKYRHYFFKENEAHQRMIQQGQKPRYVDHTRSHGLLKSASNALNAILRSDLAFPRLDQVHYFLGYIDDELGRRNEAIRHYRVVTDRYASSPFTPEAERNIAENEFNKKNYREALKWYTRVCRHTELPSYPRNLYKLAWAQFKTKQYAQALATMKESARIAASNDKFVSLRDEALNDLVFFYSEAGKVNQAREYFTEISGGAEIYVGALKRLARVYEREGRRAQALTVNNELIRQYGDSRPELTFDVVAHNVELYRKAGDANGEERALRQLVDFFVKHGSDIGHNDEDKAGAYQRTRSYLRNRATEVHKEAQKKDRPAHYSRAADLYGLYIQAFLAHDDSDKGKKELAEVRVYRSDSLLHAGRDAEAMAELEKTMIDEGDAAKSREAGVTLLNLMIKRIDAAVKAGAPGGKRDRDLEKRFSGIEERFESRFPNDPLIPELRFKKARLVVLDSSAGTISDDAREALEELIEKYPSRPESAEAAQDLVAADLKAGKQDAAMERAGKYLANAPLIHGDKKGQLKSYLESALSRRSFTEIQELEKSNDYGEAAVRYEALASQSKDKEVAQKSLNNAAVSYEKAGRMDDALRLYERLNETKSMKALASRALWHGDAARAAGLYERFSRNTHFSESERRSFSATALRLRWGMGEKERALDTARATRASFCQQSSDEWCETLLFWTAELADELGRPQDTVQVLRSYVGAPVGVKKGKGRGAVVAHRRQAEAYFRLHKLYEKFGEQAKALQNLQEAARAHGPSRKDRSFAAQAAFSLVGPDYRRFISLKLEGTDAERKALTKRKLQAMESVSGRYNQVIALGDGEWGIASLEHLAAIFRQFAEEIERQPPPPGLDEKGIEQYRRAIAGITGPLYGRAAESVKKAYEKGIALDVTSPVFITVSRGMTRLAPRQYPPAHYGSADHLKLMGPRFDDIESWRNRVSARATTSSPGADLWVELGNLEMAAQRPRLARLYFEEALARNAKSAAAANNLAVLALMEGDADEGTQALIRALSQAEFAGEPKENLARTYLAYNLFSKALEHLKALRMRYPEDRAIATAFAVAELGAGQVAQARGRLESLGGKNSDDFVLWYNWAVAAALSESEDTRRQGLERLKEGSASDAGSRQALELARSLFENRR